MSEVRVRMQKALIKDKYLLWASNARHYEQIILLQIILS